MPKPSDRVIEILGGDLAEVHGLVSLFFFLAGLEPAHRRGAVSIRPVQFRHHLLVRALDHDEIFRMIGCVIGGNHALRSA